MRARRARIQPHSAVLESFADLDTPLSLYVKLANAPYAFLLESVVGGERFGRYSFIGLPANVRIRARGTEIEVDAGGSIVERHEGDPLAFVGEFMRRYRAAPRPGLPRFCGGLAGYFGYDTVRHIETKLAGQAPPAVPGLADVQISCSSLPKGSRSSTTSPARSI